MSRFENLYPYAMVATYIVVAVVAVLDLFIWRP
jgi:hypothetical protein